MDDLPAPGWYPDPSSAVPAQRWWDGLAWTPQARRLAPLAPVANRRLADPGNRLLARIVDSLILAGVLIPLFLALFLTTARQAFSERQVTDSTATAWLVSGWLLLVLFALLAGVVPFVYEALMLARDGQTLGKKLLHIRVVRLADGHPPSLGEAVGRTLLTAALSGFWLDPLWCLWDQPWRQCLHDKAVRTIVVPA